MAANEPGIPGLECVQHLQMFKGVGRTKGLDGKSRIKYRVQIAAVSKGEASLVAKTFAPDAQWTVVPTKTTSQPILGWCNRG